MSQGYTMWNGADDEERRLAQEPSMARLREEWLQGQQTLALREVATACLAALLPTASVERAVGDAIAAAKLLLSRLRREE